MKSVSTDSNRVVSFGEADVLRLRTPLFANNALQH